MQSQAIFFSGFITSSKPFHLMLSIINIRIFIIVTLTQAGHHYLLI